MSNMERSRQDLGKKLRELNEKFQTKEIGQLELAKGTEAIIAEGKNKSLTANEILSEAMKS